MSTAAHAAPDDILKTAQNQAINRRRRRVPQGEPPRRPCRYSSLGHDLAGTSMLPELGIHERLPVNSRLALGLSMRPRSSDFSSMPASTLGGI